MTSIEFCFDFQTKYKFNKKCLLKVKTFSLNVNKKGTKSLELNETLFLF